MDKVRPLKIENDIDGTQNDQFTTELNPNEDYIAAKGLAFENTDTHYIDIYNNEITLTDPVSGKKRLSELAASGSDEKIKISNNDTTAGFLNGKLVAGSNITLIENNDGNNETLTITSNINDQDHRNLDTLVHNIAENGYKSITRNSNNRITNITMWTNSTMTTPIRETQISRDSNNKITQVTIIQYDNIGNVKETLVKNINRINNKVDHVTYSLT